MKLTLYILTSIFALGSVWFGRLAWIANTNHDFTLYVKGPIAIICALIALGLGVWAILS